MRRTLVVALALAVVFAAGCSKQAAPGGAGGGGGKKGRGGAADGPVPVTVVAVQSQDVPIYLDGLGSVQAFNNATLQPQVTGQLIAVPFKEGDEVKRGDLIAQIDPRSYQAQLDQAIAKKAQDQATLVSAKLDLTRYQDLLPDGFVSKQQVDQQFAAVGADQATVQSDEAAIENARVQLSYCTIHAPFDGVVGIRQVDVGNLVQGGSSTGIVVITQIKPISVSFTLPEQALAEIRKADTQKLVVVAINRDNKSELARGELLAFDNQIDQTTGTIKLKATFTNGDKTLWPGQFVNVRLLVRTQKDGLTIPAPAVQRGPNGSFVYVVKPDQTVEMRSLTVAQSEDGLALIGDGLKAGEQVVTDGQYRLQPGSKITISTDAAAAPPESKKATSDDPSAASTATPQKHKHATNANPDADSQAPKSATPAAPHP
ncbi:MAG: efflux transporter periplasmic adaptor subunit [Nevskia sp.]|nr:efflux transporter periplasmic adaptor subunit [Nevskia sp.]